MADIVLKLKIDGKEFNAELSNSDQLIKTLRKSSESVTKEASNWSNVATGFKQSLDAVKQVMNEMKGIVFSGEELRVLRNNMSRTTEELELLRKATSGIVTEANLLKLSQQAQDLGINLEQQAVLFDLADTTADKYGGTIEQIFMQIVNVTEGMTRGLRQLGIQQRDYELTIKEMLKAHGVTLEQLDAEGQKRIRLEAIMKLSGKSLDDLNNKVFDNDDKMKALGVRVEDVQAKIGKFIGGAITPLIDKFNESGDAGDIMIGVLSTMYGVVLPLVPAMASLKAAMILTAGQKAAVVGTAGTINTLTASIARLFGVVAVGIAAGYGVGKVVDWAKDEFGSLNQLSEGKRKSGVKQPGEDLSWMTGGKRFVPGTGMFQLTDEKFKSNLEDVEDTLSGITDEWIKLHTISTKDKKEGLSLREEALRESLDRELEMQDKFREEIWDADLEDIELADYNWQERERLKVEAMQEGFDKQRALIELWYAEQRETELYKESVDAKASIDQIYFNKKMEQEKEVAATVFMIYADLFANLASIAGQHTAFGKAMAIVSATINTYEGATKALAAYPPPFNFVAAASVIAAGLGHVATIGSQKVPGYARGGAVVGEDGVEIIAPVEDYAMGNKRLVAATVLAVSNHLRGMDAAGSSKDSKMIIDKLDKVEKAFTRKQFRLRRGQLTTANEKDSLIKSLLEF